MHYLQVNELVNCNQSSGRARPALALGASNRIWKLRKATVNRDKAKVISITYSNPLACTGS